MSDKKSRAKKDALLQQWLKRKPQKAKVPSISPRPEGSLAPLSYGQERLWLLQQLYPDNAFYHYAHRYRFTGSFDAERFGRAVELLSERHQVLRSTFSEVDGQIRQVPRSEASPERSHFDLREYDAAEQAHQIAQQREAWSRRPFDLANGPLLRVATFRTAPEQHEVLLVIHHIIGDRWSLRVLQEELARYYENPEAPLEALPIQYGDYAHWQRQQTQNQSHLDYWRRQLAGELPVLQLPADRPRPANPSFRGGMMSQTFDPQLSQQIRRISQQQQTTLYAVLLTAFKVLLQRYTGQHDILVGTPFTNRDKVVLEKLIGFFNETLVLRSDLSDDPSFDQLLQRVKKTTADAFAHQQMPFDRLVRELQVERMGSANPIFQVMFLFNNAAPSPAFGSGLELREESIDLGVSKFDLTLFINDEGEQLSATFEYASDLFDASTIQRMQGHFEQLLRSIVAQPTAPVSTLDLLATAERQEILEEWNRGDYAAPSATSIHELFEAQATQHPERRAVVFRETSLTYGELNERAEALAQYLRGQEAWTAGPVGLFVPPSVDMMVGIWGILKAGGAYLPLDPAYPSERIAYMLSDAEVKIVLTPQQIRDLLPAETEAKIICLEEVSQASTEPEPLAADPDRLAYMIYTSGSSGQPKGVPITHRNLLHSTVARFHFYDTPPQAFLLLSSFSFDSSVAGIFWTLCAGGTLVLTERRSEQNILALAQLFQREAISHTLMLPSLYDLLVEHASTEQLQSLRTVMVAGEACSPRLVNKHFEQLPQVRLYNEYGPTEATVWSTAHEIRPVDAETAVPIGRPIPYLHNYILDQQLQPVPVGVAGELYIGGVALSRGYWKRPQLTAEKFVPHPFQPGQRLYKTGDLARYRRDGRIDFLGRADHQVKIRGHRVELDEIKSVLLRFATVQEAVVQIQTTDAHQRIVAYLVGQEGLDTEALRGQLKRQLPAYMVPAQFVVLEAFPLLPNGKIDQKKLPVVSQSEAAQDRERTPAESPTEVLLAEVWQSVLQLDAAPSVYDNFFALGGDSIRSIAVIAKAQKKGLSLAPNHLFDYQNIRELAQFLDRPPVAVEQTGQVASAWSTVVPLNKGAKGRPLFCIHSGGAHVFFYRALAERMGQEQAIYALQPAGLGGEVERPQSIEEMATAYIEALRSVQATGPYSILGTCFSNAVGLEMAHQLREAGQRVDRLIFVDSGPVHLQSATARGEKQTLKRMGAMLAKGDWSAIRKKLHNRFYYFRQKVQAPFENEQEKNLRLTITNLNQLYKYYDWQPYEGEIIFIRSSEFAGRSDKDYHISQWTELAKGGLEVHVVEGHHLTLFEEPEVAGLAEQLKVNLTVLS
ncbi:MAG: amino acid adenylation domain-containing protein [Bacteroidota bacterium]